MKDEADVTHSCAGAGLTLVIPTRNRPRFLSKVLRYYAKMESPYPLIIGDASDPSAAAENERVIATFEDRLPITYVRQAPGITTVTSTIDLLARVDSRYTAWCGDDDYMVPRQLQKCADFLEGHPDYGLACGDAAEVFVETSSSDDTFTVAKIIRGAHKSAEATLPSRRLLEWCRPNIGKNTFSVQRTSDMRYSWNKASEIGLDSKSYAPLHELTVNLMSLLQGKEMHLEGLYHVMLRHTEKTSFSGPVDYFERVTRWDWPGRVASMVDCWAQEIVRRETIEYSAARRVAETVFLQWLIPFLARNRDRKLREHGLITPRRTVRDVIATITPVRSFWYWIRGEHAMSLETFLKRRSFYYGDFHPIYDVLSQSESA